jgi:hypothetical protein
LTLPGRRRHVRGEELKERFDSRYSWVVAKIFDRLPDATWGYPGHGGNTTLGVERPKPSGVA